MKKKKLAFFGSVGYNIGDEAIAVAAGEYLQLHHANLEVVVCTLENGVIEGKYAHLKEFIINRKTLKGWMDMFRFLYSVDVVAIGGGTMIQDKLGISYIRGMIPYIYQITLIAKLLNKQVVTLPIGVDKLSSEKGPKLAKKIFTNIEKVHVRDEKSKQLALEYSNKSPESIQVSADPAFLLKDVVYQSPGRKQDQEIQDKFPDGYVSISLVNENINKTNYYHALLQSIDWILTNTNLGIVLVPMDRRDSEEKEIFKELVLDIKTDYLSRVYELDAELDSIEITEVLRKSRTLIAMRLHAMILSVGYTEIIGLSRTTKTDTFLKEFSLPNFNIENGISSEALIQSIKNILEKKDGIMRQEREHQKRIRQEKNRLIEETLKNLTFTVKKAIR